MTDKTAEDWADAIEAQLLDKWCGDNEYCQSRTGDVAAALRTAHDKGRAMGMREAADIASKFEDEWALEWRKGHKSDSHLEGKSDGADNIWAAILEAADKLETVPTQHQTRKELT